MSWQYYVLGALRFKADVDVAAWRKQPLAGWRGKGKLSVADALARAGIEGLVDDSAPAEYQQAYFLDIEVDGAEVRLRGFVHRDESDFVVEAVSAAASAGAKGGVRLEHVLDSDSGIRVALASGKATVKQTKVTLPAADSTQLQAESEARAKQRGKKRAKR